MIEKFPIPFQINGTVYHSCDIESPTAGVLADTKKNADTGDKFSPTLIFLAGCIKSIISDCSEINDRLQIKSAIRHMPYRTAEVLSLKAILKIHDDDGIEGVYPCPRCNHKVISQLLKENDETISDTRDFISNLDIEYMEEFEEEFEIVLTEPPAMINSKTNEVILDVKTGRAVMMNSFSLVHPTIGHCIEAQTKQGATDEMRLQYRIYVEAIKKIDGYEVDKSFREKYVMTLFEKIPNINDIGKIAKKVNQYGIERRVNKICPSCGKEYKAVLNTSNFFESAPLVM